MDASSGKRDCGGLSDPQRGSGLVLRDATDRRDMNPQFCNRLGCHGRLKHAKVIHQEYSGKRISSRSSLPTSSGKEILGSSTRTNSRKSFKNSRKELSSHLKTDSSEASSSQDEPDVSELASIGRVQTGFQTQSNNADSSKVRSIEVGTSSAASSGRPQKVFQQKSVPSIRAGSSGLSASMASRSSFHCRGSTDNLRSYSLRHLRCNSTQDVVPSGSSSEPNLSRKKDLVKQQNPEVENRSSLRGKKISGPLTVEGHGSISSNGISISDSRRQRYSISSNGISISDSRRQRYQPPSRDGCVRTQSSVNRNNRAQSVPPTGLHVVTTRVPLAGTSFGADYSCPSQQLSRESSSSHSNFYAHPDSSSSFSMPASSSTGHSSIDQDGMRQYNMDGIAEVLLALENFDQDEEITYEQLLALEAHLFLGGMGFHDLHRDMRLDIDEMSYEELLALEEKMGTVSTAIPEELMSKYLRRSIYQHTPCVEETMGCNGDYDDIRCSICQEEYVIGDEVGRMDCNHGYHLACIQQWLRMKNWCPICKALALPTGCPSSSSSSLSTSSSSSS